MDLNGDHMEMHFDYFQIQKWEKVRAEKVDEKKNEKKKMGDLSSSHVSFLTYGP